MATYLKMFFIAEIFACISVFFSNRSSGLKILNGENRSIDINSMNSHLFLWLSAVPFLYIAAMRYNVGTDYEEYTKLQIPMLLKGVDYKLKFEYLYQLLIKIGVALGDVQWVFILTHLVLLFVLWKALKNLSVDLRLSIFIFMFGTFFNYSLNTMRQCISIVIFLYAIKYIVNRDLFKYIIAIIIAFLFHKTGIFYLPLYWLSLLKIDDKLGLVLIGLGAVFERVIRVLLVKFFQLIGFYSNYFGGNYDVNNHQWDFILFNLVILLSFVIIRRYFINDITSATYKNTILTDNDKIYTFDYLLFNLQLMTTLIAFWSSIIPNSTRIIFMFAIGQIIYIPFLIKNIKDSRYRLLITSFYLVIYAVMFVRLIVMKNMGETLPYVFYQWGQSR